MANEKFSEFTVKTDLSEFTGLVGFETNTANYYITTANFYNDLEANLDLTDFTTGIGAVGEVLTVNGAGTALEWSAPASGGVSSIGFGTTGLTPSAASTGVVTVAGTLVVGHGGTGQTSYAVGDILYADTASTLAKLPASATSGHVLTSNGTGVAPSYQAVPGGGGTNSYMLTGIIDGLGSSTFDFTYFGSTLSGITDQGSGFSVFVNSELTHIGFKYLSDDALVSSTDSYVIKVYESNASFDTLPADTLSSFSSLLSAITITGDNAGGSNYGTYPFATVALGSPLTLTAGKFYAIVGERSGSAGGLFPGSPPGEEGQITLRITE